MKALTSVAGTLCLAVMPGVASANCYFVYSAQNQLIYRSTLSPVDLSRPISEGLRGRLAGGHLTMVPDETGCPDLLPSGESKVFASFGFTSGRASAIDASPLFRNVESKAATSSYDGTAVTPADGSNTKPRRAPPAGPNAPRGR